MSIYQKQALILDFDGTIADYKTREHLRAVDWDAYISASHTDTPILQTVEIINKFKGDYFIIILSARGESSRGETSKWLEKYNIYYDEMILRDNDDTRDDYLIKLDLIREKVLNRYEVFMAIDDRSSVVKLFRENGIFTIQVGDGY